ncbi:MAG: alpha/beta hydrolase [Pseudomonadota bacterium]
MLAAAVIIALLLVAGWVFAPSIERALMYLPDPTYVSPADADLTDVEELRLATSDGETVIAWYARARPGEPTLLYFHGNAGTLADRNERISKHQEAGRGVFIMSYRGYSGSTGKPSEPRNVADAKLAYDTLRSKGVAAEDVILYGESIGSGVAVQVAAEKDVGGIVLDAPYTSIVDVAEICYPRLPVRALMRDRYETLERHLPRVSAPVFVIHGEADQVIPVEMGRKIAAQAPAGGTIVTFPEAGHTDHYLYGSFEAVEEWISRLRQAGGSSTPLRGAFDQDAKQEKAAG